MHIIIRSEKSLALLPNFRAEQITAIRNARNAMTANNVVVGICSPVVFRCYYLDYPRYQQKSSIPELEWYDTQKSLFHRLDKEPKNVYKFEEEQIVDYISHDVEAFDINDPRFVRVESKMIMSVETNTINIGLGANPRKHEQVVIDIDELISEYYGLQHRIP